MEAAKGVELTFDFPQMAPDERLRELILYISARCSEDPTFGAIKLNKILYFADFLSYGMTGEPVTGAAYMRLRKGPAPRRLLPIRDKMIEDGELAIQKRRIYQHEQHRTIPLREPVLDSFRPNDISVVDELIQVFWGRTAEEVSDLSHGAAWEIAGDQENIPYQAAYLSNEGVTQDDIEKAREVATELGLGATGSGPAGQGIKAAQAAGA
ncbi:MAG TPA: Panacea domain-containing protein [Anaerolineales bacterium]|nr:Panacea domain-containing protein [Anaerolineales bacterium]